MIGLFTEPRPPQGFIEERLDLALGKGWVGWTWAELAASGATDDRLRRALLSIWSEYSSVWEDDGGWIARGGNNPKFFAIPLGGEWGKGKPDLQGAALLKIVRQLRGVWEPE